MCFSLNGRKSNPIKNHIKSKDRTLKILCEKLMLLSHFRLLIHFSSHEKVSRLPITNVFVRMTNMIYKESKTKVGKDTL